MRAPLLLLRRFRDDRRGLSIVELGLCMPILSVMLLGLIDVSSFFSAQVTVQQAAARSLERVTVSQEIADFDYVKEEAAAAAGVDEEQVDVDTWLECDNARMADGVDECDGDQAAGKYVQVTINASYTPHFTYSPLPGERQADGTVPIVAVAAVRYG